MKCKYDDHYTLLSKSIEDDSVDTIRYKAVRDRKRSSLKFEYIQTLRNYYLFKVLAGNPTLGRIRVYNLNGMAVARYITKPDIKKQGRHKMLRNTIKGRWFNG